MQKWLERVDGSLVCRQKLLCTLWRWERRARVLAHTLRTQSPIGVRRLEHTSAVVANVPSHLEEITLRTRSLSTVSHRDCVWQSQSWSTGSLRTVGPTVLQQSLQLVDLLPCKVQLSLEILHLPIEGSVSALLRIANLDFCSLARNSLHGRHAPIRLFGELAFDAPTRAFGATRCISRITLLHRVSIKLRSCTILGSLAVP